MKKKLLTILFALPAFALLAQRGPVKELPLADMSAFQPQAGNWSIVGHVSVDPRVSIHDKPAPAVSAEAGKKKKKKGEPAPEATPPPKAISAVPGTGVLLNMNDEVQKDHLLTAWEHGDILLEMEVMVPKGSNSGIYLQGRYEVQILDSWGKQNPAYGDIGGIYRNWETEPGNIYMGKAPSTNAAKAPGLWQHFNIAFQAPRFDAQGNKTQNARFVFVELNGVRIHENLEVPLPTGGPVAPNEVALGPLMIQGDHGPVAFRNIRYQLLEQKPMQLTDLSYQWYEGVQEGFDSFVGQPADQEGQLQQLTLNIAGVPGVLGLVLKGNIEVAETANYDLLFDYAAGNGTARIKIGDNIFGDTYSNYQRLPINTHLEKGKTAFEIHYYRNSNWGGAKLELFNHGSFPVALNAYNSVLAGAEPAKNQRIYIEPGKGPKMLRAFLDYPGKPRLTHTIAIGSSLQNHFIYDLNAGTPVCAWRGQFLDATPMWDGRGDGSYQPKGAVEYLFPGASFAFLPTMDSPFPEGQDHFRNMGYRIDQASNVPVFLYQQDSLQLEDFVLPAEDGKSLLRRVSLKDKAPDGKTLYLKMAEGYDVEHLSNGLFVIDQRLYITLKSDATVIMRQVAGKTELVAYTTGQELGYTIMW